MELMYSCFLESWNFGTKTLNIAFSNILVLVIVSLAKYWYIFQLKTVKIIK
jgi:hypothetical protein